MAGLVKQAREIGAKMQAMQAQLPGLRAAATAGAGLVQVEVNGLGELVSLKIDPKLLAQQDAEMLEDLIVSASRQAQTRAREMAEELARQHAPDLSGMPGLTEAMNKLLGGGEGPLG